jgi:CHAT domain-containing protein/tetratricopeptide (TPR) repeat protein
MDLFDWFRKKAGWSPGARIGSHLDEVFQSVAELSAQGRWQRALSRAQRVTALARTHLGKAHPDYARCLNNLAMVLQGLGDSPAALPLYQRAAEITRAALGEAHPDYASSLSRWAMEHQGLEDSPAALPVYQRAAEITRAALGEAHPDYARCLNNLAVVHQGLGDSPAALPLYQRAAEITRAALGEGHPLYAQILSSLAALHRATGDYAAAEPLLRRALEIRRAALGKAHPLYAASLNNLAALHQAMGDYAAALPLHRQALKILRGALGKAHPDYAHSLTNLATAHRAMGDYATALPLYRQAAEILRDALGESHPAYAHSLQNLATVHRAMGDYPAALPLLQQALEIYRIALGTTHPAYATSVESLAMVHVLMGDHAAGLRLHRQAESIRRAPPSEAREHHTAPMHCHATSEMSVVMELPFWQAAWSRGAAPDEPHAHHAHELNNLAAAYRAVGDYAAALRLLQRAQDIYRDALGHAHPDHARSLRNLAGLHSALGNHAAALRLYREAVEIYRTALGETHPRYAASLNDLAKLLAATDRAKEALPLLEQAAAIDDRMIVQVFSSGSERQRIAFLDTLLSRFYQTLSLVLEHLGDSLTAVRTAFGLVLRRKAIAAEATATQRDTVLGGKYPALRAQLAELAAMRMQIARASLAGPGPEGLESHMRRLAEWSAQKERQESELACQIPEMNLEQKLRASDRRAVALGLPEGVTLVEFVRFPVRDFRAVPVRGQRRWKVARYVAFVLRAGDPDDVRMIDLGEAEPIDRLIADFRAGIVAEAESGDGRDLTKRPESVSSTRPDAGTALRETVFDKLAPALGGRPRLLIAPDGDLTRLPFEVLPVRDGRHLIDDYQISYLSCGRDVLRIGAAATGRPGAPLIVADPDFDFAIPPRPATDRESSDCGLGRRSRDLDRERHSYHFDRLPGTRAEGQRVGTLLSAEPWLDNAALEGRLKAECRSPLILHLATHGFFLPDQEFPLDQGDREMPPKLSHDSMSGVDRSSGSRMEDPMLRSGLALAGANSWFQERNLPEEAEDGLLTAEDVTGLDLLATELVVLSACETGLGQVHVGEGVIGLRRAFVLAGAQTLVMSLWKVPDDQTRELMEDFYRHLLAGEGRAEALRQAQLAMKAKYHEPFYWGAFICQGDPAPLGPFQPGAAAPGVATDRPARYGVSPGRG